jgi:CRISPR-associated protein Csy1
VNGSPPHPELAQAHAAFARGDFAAAFAAATRLLAQKSRAVEARVLHLNAALKLERWQDAIADLDVLLAAQPGQIKLRKTLSLCWLRVGNAHKANKNVDAAAAAWRKAIEIDAENFDARFNLGILWCELGRTEQAISELRRVVDAKPSDDAAALELAEAQIAAGAGAAAFDLLERIARRGGTRENLQRCSRLLLESCAIDAAKALARRLIDEQPQARAWGREFCRQLRRDGDMAGNRELLGLMRDRAGDDVERLRIDLALALGLPSTYPDRQSLQTMRADYLARLDDFVAAYPAQRIVTIAPPPEALLWDNFYLAYQGENDRDPQARFGRWLNASLATVLPAYAAPAARVQRARPRLAMVSSRFHDCTAGAYFASWVEHLATTGWELILVHVGDYRDHLSARLARAAHAELTLDGNVTDNARKLHELAADLIVYPELGMDYRTLALAALRLAPRQACAWGHPVTTGLPTIDVFLSCAPMEPADAPMHYSERLMLLPGLGTRYLSPEIPDRATRTAVGLPEHGTLYLVPQSLFKLHPDNDSIFVDIARNDQDATLVFFSGVESGAQRAFAQRLTRTFHAMGMVFDERARFLSMRGRSEYLRVNLACDVMLDSLNWSGGNTSLDALHAGLPVVTCPGRYMRGRQSMAMLQSLDCAELIVQAPEHLATRAIEIAHARPQREALSARIAQKLPLLTQSEQPLQALDAALHSIVAEARL